MNGEDAWFIRRRSGWCTSIRPAGIKGVLLTALFVGVIELLALVLDRSDGDYWPVSVAGILGATALFVLVCYRLSAPEERS